MPTKSRQFVIQLSRSLNSAIAGTLFLGLLSGCDSQPKVPGAHLAGTVTIEGQLIDDGSIVFTPSGSARGQAVGGPIRAGHYDCPYVPLGESRVQIYALKPTGKTIEAMGSMIPEMKDLVPEKDRNGIKIEIQQDNLNQNFSLTQ
jgi:hypothetical protein